MLCNITYEDYNYYYLIHNHIEFDNEFENKQYIKIIKFINILFKIYDYTLYYKSKYRIFDNIDNNIFISFKNNYYYKLFFSFPKNKSNYFIQNQNNNDIINLMNNLNVNNINNNINNDIINYIDIDNITEDIIIKEYDEKFLNNMNINDINYIEFNFLISYEDNKNIMIDEFKTIFKNVNKQFKIILKYIFNIQNLPFKKLNYLNFNEFNYYYFDLFNINNNDIFMANILEMDNKILYDYETDDENEYFNYINNCSYNDIF